MTGFKIILNGEVYCIAADTNASVLHAVVTARGKLGSRSKGTKQIKDRAVVDLHVGCMTDDHVHIRWNANPKLKVGDEVTIKIVDVDEPDEPTRRERIDPQKMEEMSKQFRKQKRKK